MAASSESLTFDWSVYPYVRNKATQDFGGYSWDRLQAFMYGVDTITEQGGGQTRVTSHSRWVPRLTGDMAGHTWAAPWVSKTFMDTITYPDGRKAVHHFVEPLDTSGAGGTPDQQMQTLAHLKHLIKQSEYIGPLGGSPHTVQTFDEWSLRKVGNPDGLPQVGSLPYPIHTSTVHALEGFVVDERKNYWDSVNYGWGLSTRRVTQTGQADLNRDVQRGWKFVPELWLGPDETLSGRYPELLDWIRARHRAGAHLYSACSGSLMLAETGLLDGRDATSHWGYEDLFRQRYPRIRFRPEPTLCFADPRGRIVTAGGTTSWHDLALHIIARHASPGEAMRIAKVYLLKLHTDGQLPYSTLVRPQPHADAVVKRLEVIDDVLVLATLDVGTQFVGDARQIVDRHRHCHAQWRAGHLHLPAVQHRTIHAPGDGGQRRE